MTVTFIKNLHLSVDNVCPNKIIGRITAIHEFVLEALLPGVNVGALVQIGEDTLAQVAKVDAQQCKLVLLTDAGNIQRDSPVSLLGQTQTVPVGESLIGRIITPLGEPMDNNGRLPNTHPWPLQRTAPHPLKRPCVCEQLHTGVKAIDALLSLGKGGRIGMVAGPGQGKSTLLGTLAANADCDVAVICLAGERGREAGEFVSRNLGSRGLSRSVVVLATSDTPAAQRVLAIHSATAIAEWFRDQGKNVLLLVDSLTRIVRAKRDVDLALGIPVGPGGLATTTLSFLPAILERAAPNQTGVISAVYTVLQQTQGDELISNEISSLLDGHILLSKKRADAGKWPAINVVESISRVMNNVTTQQHQKLAATIRSVLAAWEENEELVLIGAYTKGSCPYTDLYLCHKNAIDTFLIQGKTPYSLDETAQCLQQLVATFGLAEPQ